MTRTNTSLSVTHSKTAEWNKELNGAELVNGAKQLEDQAEKQLERQSENRSK